MCKEPPNHDIEPKDSHCHVYHINKDGPDSERPMKSQLNVPFSGDGIVFDNLNMVNDGASAYNRFTLIQLPDTVGTNVKQPICDEQGIKNLHWKTLELPLLPPLFHKQLQKICPHCCCKEEILWRTLFRQDHHFESCFRYVDKKDSPGDRCFLKLYSMRVPSLSYPKLTFSMVYHIRVEGDKFVPQENPEHLFAFIAGVKTKYIKQLLDDFLPRFLDIRADHAEGGTRMTSRVFLAALLGGYGSIISPYVRWTADELQKFDDNLEKGLEKLKTTGYDDDDQSRAPDVTTNIQSLNQSLIKFNRQLTSVRSTMHYLSGSAKVMVKDITAFEDYVAARIKHWAVKNDSERQTLGKELEQLDVAKEHFRDHDKLVMIQTNIFQYTMDIKSLQQHIDINIGMVRNVIAERDRAIQRQIEVNTGRDGHKMMVIAILTALFLPGTFVGILLTVPMFNWDDVSSPLLKRLPSSVYFGATGPLTFLFLIWIITFKRLKNLFGQVTRFSDCNSASKRPQGGVDGSAVVGGNHDVESGVFFDGKTGIQTQTSWFDTRNI